MLAVAWGGDPVDVVVVVAAEPNQTEGAAEPYRTEGAVSPVVVVEAEVGVGVEAEVGVGVEAEFGAGVEAEVGVGVGVALGFLGEAVLAAVLT